MNEFKDIMPNEIIVIDYFKYIYLAIFLVFILFTLVFIIKKINKSRNNMEIILSKEQIAIKKLDLNAPNAKQILYDFTILAKECQNQKYLESSKKRLEEILIKIEPLKYQKNEIILDENLKKILKEYIDDLAF